MEFSLFFYIYYQQYLSTYLYLLINSPNFKPTAPSLSDEMRNSI